MIVDTLAKAQEVVAYFKASGTSLGVVLWDNATKDELINAVRAGDCIIALRSPDGGLEALRDHVAIGAYTTEWCVRWVAGSTQATFRGLFLDFANELVSRGEGDVPVYWTQSGTIAKFAATRLGARTVTVDGQGYYWFTANEAIASGKL